VTKDRNYWKSRAHTLQQAVWPGSLLCIWGGAPPVDTDWAAWIDAWGRVGSPATQLQHGDRFAPHPEAVIDALLALDVDDPETIAAEHQKVVVRLEAQVEFLRLGGDTALLSDYLAAQSAAVDTNAHSVLEIAASAMSATHWLVADVASRRAVQLDRTSEAAHRLRSKLLARRKAPGLAAAHLACAIAYGGRFARDASTVLSEVRPFLRDVGLFDALSDALQRRGAAAEGVAAFVRASATWDKKTPLELAFSLCRMAPRLANPPAGAGNAPPLVLISQVQRSGGSLLNQLFDGHSQLLTHPHELKIGHPTKWNWPKIDTSDSPETWFSTLFEPTIAKFMVEGYSKPDGNEAAREPLPFTFDIPLFCRTFVERAAGSTDRRRVIDAYLEAYFAAWEEGGHRGDEALWTVGFCPRLISTPESMRAFFDDYPDGKLVSCIRNPKSWYVSSSRHAKTYEAVDEAMDLWIASTEAAFEWRRRHPNSVRIVTYERIVRDSAEVMAELSAWLGIRYEAALNEPTYAGRPTVANSSFRVETRGVHREALNRDQSLSAEASAYIERRALPLYMEVVRATGSVAAAP